jgi:predicted RNase H-like nuclease (RuvC/YqgF family)
MDSSCAELQQQLLQSSQQLADAHSAHDADVAELEQELGEERHRVDQLEADNLQLQVEKEEVGCWLWWLSAVEVSGSGAASVHCV